MSVRGWLGWMLLLSSALAFAAEPPRTVSARLLDHLQGGRYTEVEAMFTPAMAQAVPAEKLKTLWASLEPQFGRLQRRGEPVVSSRDGMQIVVTRLHFERGALDAQVAVDADGRVAGLLLRPAAADRAAAVPVPPDATYEERALDIGAGEHALPGTLAMPKGAGPFPAVVLVHGSGPHDRDETIGPNRPFLDIARGLASQGIAVLRYEKRTHAQPEAFAGRAMFTVDDEATDDAVAAIAALRAQPHIDGKRVFVFGHSLGGMIAPRIARQSGQVAGLVLLAAPARSLMTILPEQNRFLLGAQGAASPEGRAFLAKLDAQIAHVRGTGPDTSTDTPLGLPAGYWRSLEAIDPVGEAVASGLPVLLLQGGRDFQVVDADWRIWQDTFATQRNARLHHYPDLNHLGIAGTGAPSMAEYQKAGHVDARLIDDVAQWIKEY